MTRFLFAANKTEVSRFCFPFTEDLRKLPFSVRSVFHLLNSGNVETWTRRHGYMEIWRHDDGDMETWRHRHGDRETWRNGDMETWTWRYGDIKQKTEAQAIFLDPLTVCSSCKQKFVVSLLVDEVTDANYPFSNRSRRTKWTCPSIEIYTNNSV
jgi:hypothetical protein